MNPFKEFHPRDLLCLNKRAPPKMSSREKRVYGGILKKPPFVKILHSPSNGYWNPYERN